MPDPNRQDIDVILTPVEVCPEWPNGIKFELSSPLGSSNRLTFRNNGRPGFRLRFRIVDDHKTGFRFPDDEKAAMWVWPVQSETDPCPHSASYWPTFEATDVAHDNQVLRVTNRNDCHQLFAFTLLFTKTPDENGPCIEFDPIGDNRNGYSWSALAAWTAGTGVVAIALAVTALFRKRRH